MSYIGSVWTYRVFAIVAAVCAAFYIVFQVGEHVTNKYVLGLLPPEL